MSACWRSPSRHCPDRGGATPAGRGHQHGGGWTLPALDEQLMLHGMPGVFCAGEMLDWEAPTGGYLLTASMATGMVWQGGCRALAAQNRQE